MSPLKVHYWSDLPLDLPTEIVPESPPTLQIYLANLSNSVLSLCHGLEKAQLLAKYFAGDKRCYKEFEEKEMVFC